MRVSDVDAHCGTGRRDADSRIVTVALSEADRSALRARLAAHLTPGWRTRFAPAPTGHLHLGHAVNAVYVWSIAQAYGGNVIVRIEDHDRQRSRAEFETSIRADLAWLGLSSANIALGLPEELRQSDHAESYADALTRLEARAQVYACRCSRREIAAVTRTPISQEDATSTQDGAELRYPGTCRDAQMPLAATPARRFALSDDTVAFDDLRHGLQRQTPSAQCGDLLVRDRLGQWTYQFAVVVDDWRHGIDLVIRGDDLLASTGRQRLLAAALGAESPAAVLHHPLIVHADGTKLSKSQGDTGLRELRDAGWSPEQLLGHAAWLGGLQSSPAPIGANELAALWAP